MASIGRITFEDKVDYRQEGQDDRFKITANDINQLKEVFNNSASAIEKTMDLQSDLESAIAQCGNYKIENGKIYFINSKGTYGEGIELPAQSSIFIGGIVQGTINLDDVYFLLTEDANTATFGTYQEYLANVATVEEA